MPHLTKSQSMPVHEVNSQVKEGNSFYRAGSEFLVFVVREGCEGK